MHRRLLKRYIPAGNRLFIMLIGFFVFFSVLGVLIFKWNSPTTSSFMLQRKYDAWQNENKDFTLHYEWTDWENISPYVKVAAITSEDQRFAKHWGFDLKAIRDALQEHQQGEDLRGASTITQQVAKNLFLWPESSYLRKAFEAYLTVLLETFWSKKRILEVYLNIAEFGDGVYGVKAASRIYFNTTPDQLNMQQSALMITALPSPKRYNLANPSPYMIERRNWILKYMFYLGNTGYLERLQ